MLHWLVLFRLRQQITNYLYICSLSVLKSGLTKIEELYNPILQNEVNPALFTPDMFKMSR